MASFERQIRRSRGYTRGLNLRGMFREAQLIKANQRLVQGFRGNRIIRDATDYIPEEMKVRAKYRYVYEARIRGLDRVIHNKVLSFYSDVEGLTKTQIERMIEEELDGLLKQQYVPEFGAGSEVRAVNLINAYQNIL